MLLAWSMLCYKVLVLSSAPEEDKEELEGIWADHEQDWSCVCVCWKIVLMFTAVKWSLADKKAWLGGVCCQIWALCL